MKATDTIKTGSGVQSPPVGGLRRARRLAPVALVLAVTVLAYANSFQGAFVFDDPDSITDNGTIRHLGNVRAVFSPPRDGRTVEGRPLLNFTFAVNYALGGPDVWGYHAVNLLIHCLSALILLDLVRRTLRLPRMPEDLSRHAEALATVVALVWAVHPLNCESVTYVVQRAESLMALFYLLTLYLVLRGATSAGQSRCWYLAAVLACALGMASKEVMVTVPVMALLYDRIFLAGSWGQLLRRRWRVHAGLAATWGVLAALVIPSLNRGGSAGFGAGVSPRDYAITQFGAVAHYLRLAFWPDVLVFDYGSLLAGSLSAVAASAVVVTVLVLAAMAMLKLRPMWGLLLAWFFVILAPSSSIVPVVTQTCAEHRAYLPLAGVVALVVIGGWWGWCRLLGARRSAGARWPGVLAAAAAAVVVAALAARTAVRNGDYRSDISIWAATARDCPQNPRAWGNLAQGYSDAGLYPQALAAADRATAVDRNFAGAHAVRGFIYGSQGRFDEAVRECSEAIALERTYHQAWYNRGLARQQMGQLDEAIADYTQAIVLKSDFASAYGNRASAWNAVGNFPQALADSLRSLELKEADPLVHDVCGISLYGLGRPEEAVAQYTRALELNASLGDVYYNRAVAFFRLRRYDLAWADLAAARQRRYIPDPKFVEELSKASPGR